MYEFIATYGWNNDLYILESPKPNPTGSDMVETWKRLEDGSRGNTHSPNRADIFTTITPIPKLPVVGI